MDSHHRRSATLSIGAIAIQPGNTDPANTVILAATGEANNSGDSYFGLGILRSTDAGNTWTLIPTANDGALSFSGLGGTRMAFSTAGGQTNTVVAAMATSSEGLIDGAVTANTTRGLYTSLDAGQTWTYDALADPGGATDATSATSVVYNASAGLFFAAVRYHGFYSSPDGTHWTRLTAQPGGAALSTAACPPQSTFEQLRLPHLSRRDHRSARDATRCTPGSSALSSGLPVDGGIWQSLNGGASWTAISDTGITNCGDIEGCGVQQGSYNLELLAVPNASGTDLYAGAINLYKCAINSQNPTCAASPFMNLTHVYGCDPIAAPAHVHPDQHALAFAMPTSGTDSGNALMYFANDGGIYRALDGFGRAEHRLVLGHKSVRRSQSESGIDDAVRQLLATPDRCEHAARRHAGQRLPRYQSGHDEFRPGAMCSAAMAATTRSIQSRRRTSMLRIPTFLPAALACKSAPAA